MGDELVCAECGNEASFKVLPIGIQTRDQARHRGMFSEKKGYSILSCGRDLAKVLRKTRNRSAIVRVIE